MKKKLIAIISIVLVVAIIIGGVCVCLVKKKESYKAGDETSIPQKENVIVDGNNPVNIEVDMYYTCLKEGIPDVLVVDESTVIDALESVSDSLGISNVKKELKVINIETVKGDSYYRLQQYYQNVPVYGRRIVVSVDKNGKVTSLVSNYKPVSKDFSFDCLASNDEIKASIKEFLNVDEIPPFNVSEDNRVVYNFDDKETMAYNLNIGSGEFIIDANTSDVVQFNQTVRDITAEVWSEDGSVSSIGWQNDDGSFHLYNDEYNIEVFDVDNIDTAIDKKGNVHENFKNYGIDTLYSADNNFNKDAIMVLNEVIDVSYFYENLGFDGFERVHVAINDEFDDGENARGGGGKINNVDSAILLFGSEFEYDSKDVIAHEYTHAVTRLVVGWSGDNIETAALNEAYSDIFGALFENPENPDWKMVHLSKVIRDITDPSKTNGYDDMSDINESGKYDEYTLSTIISHSAYLMWNGINGREELKIDGTTLSELWYRSMLMLPSDADFSQCRNAVELAARIMYKNGKLSKDQLKTVFAAFEIAGVENATYTVNETVNNRFDLSVLSSKETENVQYNLDVIKIINGEPSEAIMKETDVSGKQSLNLEDGTYLLRITETSDKNTAKTVDVKIVVDGDNANAKNEVIVNTDFSDVTDINTDADNSSQSGATNINVPAGAIELNGHYYMVFDDSVTWYEANVRCKEMGGHLVTITSQEEQDLITNLISGRANNCYWLGATRSNNKGSWRWITGESFGYTNWKREEPNNQDNKENCLEIFANTYKDISVGQWNDIMPDGRNGLLDNDFYSSSSVGYICEWEY